MFIGGSPFQFVSFQGDEPEEVWVT